MDDQDEYRLTEHDRMLARAVAQELMRTIQQEAGKAIISKLFWGLVMFVFGGGVAYLSTKH